MAQLIPNQARAVSFALLSFLTLSMGVSAADTVENYIAQYPNQQQAKMMNAWLAKHKKGTFSFSGLVDPTDTTVVTPQATVDYGYNWFSVSDGPAIVATPQYDKFFSVSVFDMKHNVPAVVVNPQRPLVIVRPGQAPYLLPDPAIYLPVRLREGVETAHTRSPHSKLRPV
jgi:hypothetical protein